MASDRDRLAFTSDQTKPQLAIIDTRARKVRNWVALPATGYGTAATPDGKWLVIAIAWPLLPIRPNLNLPSLIHARARSATGSLCLPQDMEQPRRRMANG